MNVEPMATDLKPLRRGILELYEKRKIGDLTERKFQSQLADKTVDLYRALVRDRMADGERIELEHHTILSHFKLTMSVMREPEQFATSLFATDRRLFRVRSTVIFARPPTGDKRDETVVDSLSYKRMTSLKLHRQVRWLQAGVGATFAAIAIVFAPWLDMTGPFLLGFSVLGILHAVLLPSRWMEVVAADPIPDMDPININVLRKKSAKALLRFLREKLER